MLTWKVSKPCCLPTRKQAACMSCTVDRNHMCLCGAGLEGHTQEFGNCASCTLPWRRLAYCEHGIVYLSSCLMMDSGSFQVRVPCLQLQTGKMTARRVYFNTASADWKSRHTCDNMAEAGLSSHMTCVHGHEAPDIYSCHSWPTSGGVSPVPS